MNENSKALLGDYIEKLRKKLDEITENLAEYSYDEDRCALLNKHRAITEIRIGEAQKLLLSKIKN